MEDRCKWLEEKFKALENADGHHRVDVKDLSLVPDLVLLYKFKMPKFEKYNGTTCLEAHITMFCRKMTGYVNNDQLLIHCFQDSLIGAAAKWYNQLSRARISSWRDLAQAFMQQYNHMTDMAPDRIRQESGTRKNSERMQFTPIPVTYRELYQSLYDAHVISPFHLKPLQPPYPKWYDANAICKYHAGIPGYSIENCTGFKKAVERLIKMGVVNFNNTLNTENPLPNHSDQGVNVIGETSERRIKEGMAEARTPMKMIWEEMVKREMIISKERNEGARDYCEFHAEEGHKIQECDEFKALIQSLMDNKELGFYEAGPNERHICTLEGAPKNQNRPRIIISLPGNNKVEIPMVPKVIFHKPVSFPYKDNKRVPWSYNCHVSMPEREDIASASKEVQGEGSHTRSGRRYDTVGVREEPTKTKNVSTEKEKEAEAPSKEPVKEEEAKEFLKFLKHSEYSVVEQLHKQSAHISVLALLLSSEVHRDALMKVLNETYVTHNVSVNKLDRLVNNISADNFIYFNDDEIPPGGRGSTKALHITTRCKGYTLPSMLVDNGSALNVLPLSTLNRLPIDDSHMKTCQNVVRVFDGTERKVMGRIDIPLEIGPNIYEVDFLEMDIQPSYNCLLGRPWIHSVGAVPSSLHQKLKLVTDGRLVTINAEEDIIAAVTSKAPYVETNEESIQCSFHSLEFVNATFISKGSEPPAPKIARATRMALQMIVGNGALSGRGLGKYLQGGNQIPELKEKKDRFGLGFKPDYKQRRKEVEKRQEGRRTRLNRRKVEWKPMTFPPISQTFISGGLLLKEVHQINAIHDKGSK
ncbi:uncharacterized protein [Gossypium hirsutum]|uniref:G-patch domain-containing protein n=1 Tax=Gossypium hirsutum TaxID=3635 RepID=A0ABM2YN50_GOSHI|nr:uncharacterized protein LOC107955903 [Gossypium hirsutum]